MDRRTKILIGEFNPESENCRTYDADLQLAITLNPDLYKIKNAMDSYMKVSVLEAFEYIVKNTTGHSIDENGKVQFKFKGEWITTKQLFENFI